MVVEEEGIGRRKKEGGKNVEIRQGVDWIRLVKCFANFLLLGSKIIWQPCFKDISGMFREIRQNRDIYAK